MLETSNGYIKMNSINGFRHNYDRTKIKNGYSKTVKQLMNKIVWIVNQFKVCILIKKEMN